MAQTLNPEVLEKAEKLQQEVAALLAKHLTPICSELLVLGESHGLETPQQIMLVAGALKMAAGKLASAANFAAQGLAERIVEDNPVEAADFMEHFNNISA